MYPVVVHWDVAVDGWHVLLRAAVPVADSASGDPAVICFADKRPTRVPLASVNATRLVARTDLRCVVDRKSCPGPASLRLEDVLAGLFLPDRNDCMIKCVVGTFAKTTDDTAAIDGGHEVGTWQAGRAHVVSPSEGEVELKQRNVVVEVLVVARMSYRTINGAELV